MDYYLFAARSVTHAQRMARLLSDEGVPVKIRRAGNAITGHGCGVLPVKALLSSNGTMREVAL